MELTGLWRNTKWGPEVKPGNCSSVSGSWACGCYHSLCLVQFLMLFYAKQLLIGSQQYHTKHSQHTNSHIIDKEALDSPELVKGLSGNAALLRKQPRTKRNSPFSGCPLYEPKVALHWVQPFWAHGRAQVQTVCSLGQQHPFTRCSITSSSPNLRLPLHAQLHPCHWIVTACGWTIWRVTSM